ncbi:MAG: ABC transporter permease subunit [Anaerolineaceae bacterium]|nr:ABC transporter permease subunit [Anaerolineaceae bacterium]
MKASRAFLPFLNELIGFGMLILLWAILSLFFPVYVIPSPLEIIKSIPEYLQPKLLEALWLSLYRVFLGFGASLFVATMLSLLLYRSKMGEWFGAMLQAFQILPAITVGVILVILFGIGSPTPIGLAFLMSLPILTLNTMQAIRSTASELSEYMDSISADTGSRFRYLLKPALVRITKSNLLLGFGLAIKIVIMGEFIGSQDGIGYLLNRARLVFNMKEVFFYLLLLLLVTLAFQGLVNLLYSGPLKRYAYD